ncbi:hypothetical protein ACTQ46_04915 [Gallicola sp. Sow4_E12]
MERAESEETFPENTYIFIEDRTTETILSIISKLIPNTVYVLAKTL